MDEFGVIEAGGADLEESRKNRAGNSSSGSGKNKQAEDSNSFDLDNSDDLNRFIQKYETMLDGDGSNKKSNSKLGLGAGGTGRDSASDVLGVGKQASGSKQ